MKVHVALARRADVHELSAHGADSVVVPMRHPVKAARSVAEFYLGDVAGLFEITQRVINGRERYARQKRLGRRENLVRRKVTVRITNDSQDNLTLPRQTQILYILHKNYLKAAPFCTADQFIRVRIILIPRNVKHGFNSKVCKRNL